MDVVLVESPAKAKTINKYLGDDFTVLASYGHVRDLVEKDGSVRPDDDFAMSWQVDQRAKKRMDEIAAALRKAERLYLATDPDREGEAISWHVLEVLRQRGLLDGVDVKRIVFNEITKSAVLDAIENPRDIDRDLVDAYLARRALDYLVGFTLSPILWTKLPGSRSAGRVQSVALRLICEREAEIEVFRPQEYWSVEADFLTPRRDGFRARLVRLNGEKLDRMSIGNGTAADAAVQAIRTSAFTVASVERKEVRRHPAPPFTTSTLQQEASRKLRLGASRTMRIAQQLYEGVQIGSEQVGLITYMRTDSVTLSGEAVAGLRRLIDSDYGGRYLPEKPRIYKSKAKNAQEAHEAIRPTDAFRRPRDIAAYLSDEQFRLYELIWKRTVACEMASAVLDQVTIDIESANRLTGLRATGSVIKFDGFLKLYREDRDEPADDEEAEGRLLPQVAEGEALETRDVHPEQHFTQPPPRYSEASLVKKLEELGIGRPSTYASILQVLQDRNYVRLDNRRFLPEDRGRVVTSFLTNFFGRYVEYGFTADLENQLDEISGGRVDWKAVLRRFWDSFHQAVASAKELRITQVIDALDAALGPHFFPQPEDGSDPRACPKCGDGRLGLKLGRYGGFIGCSNYPECKYTRQLALSSGNDEINGALGAAGERELGTDPETGETIRLKAGPYGPYLQRGEAAAAAPADAPAADGKPAKKSRKAKAPKPPRVSLPKGVNPDDIDLDTARRLLALPREVCLHPETGKPVRAGIGRYGPYVEHEGVYKSLEAGDDVLSIGANRAIDLLSRAGRGRGGAGGRELGAHPEDGKPITAGAGRFGPYVKHGKTYASLPKDLTVDTVTLDRAVELIAAKQAKGGKAAGPAKAKAPAKAKTGKSGSGKAKSGKAKSGKSSKAGSGAAKPRSGRKAAAKAAASPETAAGGSGSETG